MLLSRDDTLSVRVQEAPAADRADVRLRARRFGETAFGWS
jgi:hypothetical protein